MCCAVRQLLIGYLVLLSGRLDGCSGQRKSKGETIISWLIPTLLISHHSLPQSLIYRRVNFFSFFSLFWVTNSLFPLLLLFRPVGHYHQGFPRGMEQENTCCEIPRRWWRCSSCLPEPPERENTGCCWIVQEKKPLSSPQCPTPWELIISKVMCVCIAAESVASQTHHLNKNDQVVNISMISWWGFAFCKR